MNGRVTITWPGFAAGGRTVAGGRVELAIKDGAITVELEPTVGAAPAGVTYRAFFRLSDGSESVEKWNVPVSATAVTVAAVRV